MQDQFFAVCILLQQMGSLIFLNGSQVSMCVFVRNQYSKSSCIDVCWSSPLLISQKKTKYYDFDSYLSVSDTKIHDEQHFRCLQSAQGISDCIAPDISIFLAALGIESQTYIFLSQLISISVFLSNVMRLLK